MSTPEEKWDDFGETATHYGTPGRAQKEPEKTSEPNDVKKHRLDRRTDVIALVIFSFLLIALLFFKKWISDFEIRPIVETALPLFTFVVGAATRGGSDK